MALSTQQLTLLRAELANDPRQLGYAPFMPPNLNGSQLEGILQSIRDGVTPCPVNGRIGGPNGVVTGATNATPIVIAATAHGLSTGEGVTIAGVLGNVAANGSWQITKIDANSFSLNNSQGTGAYTSGGTWQWCVAGVRNQFVDTQALIGVIATADLITNGIATQPTADQFGKLVLFQCLCNDGQVALTNPDGSDNNNAGILKKIVGNTTASHFAILQLEVRTGSRLEQVLGLSGITVNDSDIAAATS